ncbi:hypothetical protein P8C59_003820 [Phyllachora maydis]|uniref:Uncharacterized protein n=1 Tax=Phyllachora maydis TaxID=1825666 RepID=A0AAD9I1H1_9PEZI|nr:hypothetical protein P8C59_003820 [Phyllachora maydis]
MQRLLPRRHTPRGRVRPVAPAIRYSTATTARPAFDPALYIEGARQRVAQRAPKVIYDHLSPTHSRLLDLALAPHLPAECQSSAAGPDTADGAWDDDGPVAALPPGHHLVYFPRQVGPPDGLMPDGTDRDHWPGGPFVRRMWAGGSVRWRHGVQAGAAMRLDGSPAWCVETVGEPVWKEGKGPGDDKVFVDVMRRYGPARHQDRLLGPARLGPRAFARHQADAGLAHIEETRKLVFLRPREEAVGAANSAAAKTVPARQAADSSFVLRPDAPLLFHFSALSYNAHAIHLDPGYARAHEGHADLLVHGPLTLVLLLAAVRAELGRLRGRDGRARGRTRWRVGRLDYRNLAPLYAGRELRVCWRRGEGCDARADEGRQAKMHVWIEGPAGGLAVKGRAELEPCGHR